MSQQQNNLQQQLLEPNNQYQQNQYQSQSQIQQQQQQYSSNQNCQPQNQNQIQQRENVNKEFLALWTRLVINIMFGLYGIAIGFTLTIGCYLSHYSTVIFTGLLLIVLPLFVNMWGNQYKSKLFYFLIIFFEFACFIILCIICEQTRTYFNWEDNSFYNQYCTVQNQNNRTTTITKVPEGVILTNVLMQCLLFLINMIIHIDEFLKIYQLNNNFKKLFNSKFGKE